MKEEDVFAGRVVPLREYASIRAICGGNLWHNYAPSRSSLSLSLSLPRVCVSLPRNGIDQLLACLLACFSNWTPIIQAAYILRILITFIPLINPIIMFA